MSILTGGAARNGRLERLVADLVGEVTTLRERVADLESERGAIDRVAGELRGMGQRLDAEIEKFGAAARQIVALDRKLEEVEKSGETQRRKLVALAKSMEWEIDSLRKSLRVLLAHTGIVGEQMGTQGLTAHPLPPAADA